MKNLLFTFRMLKRNRLMTFIAIPGLAIGLSAFLLLGIYLKYELSFDRHFKNSKRVYRLYTVAENADNKIILSIGLRTAYTQLPANVPEVEKATQTFSYGLVKLQHNDREISDISLKLADAEFFDVFGIPLSQGNPQEALKPKNAIVLTESTAIRLFGTTDCLGKSITSEDMEPAVITGITADLPTATHFRYDALLSSASDEFMTSQTSLEFMTYYLLKKGANPETAEQNINTVYSGLTKGWAERTQSKVGSGIEPLTSLHMRTITEGDEVQKVNPLYLYIAAGTAFFILLIAVINYLNMYLLSGEQRISEISARRAAGATKSTLARQFYTETAAISILAFALAIPLTIIALPYFGMLMNTPLTTVQIFNTGSILLALIIMGCLILLSGAYPSLYLSRLNLVSGLRGKRTTSGKHENFGRAAVLIQFFVSVLLICSLLIIYSQVSTMKKVPLGFNSSNLVEVGIYSREGSKNMFPIVDEVKNLPFVESVGSSSHRMGGGASGQTIRLQSNSEKKHLIDEYRVNPGFCETMQLELISGRFFREGEQDMRSVILNETAAKMLTSQDLTDKQIVLFSDPLTVAGIVKDFYSTGYAGEKIEPLVLTNYRSTGYFMYIRLKDGLLNNETRQLITETIQKFDPEYSPSFNFISDRFEAKFKREDRLFSMVSSGAIIAILLSFIGLVALTIITVSRKTKEIGVRKVLGSTEVQIVQKLITQNLILITIASAAAFATSYYLMNQWLSNFAIRISIHVGFFILSGLAALLLATFAIGWQSWRAATRNPVEALRYE